jgi:hypothetical protein
MKKVLILTILWTFSLSLISGCGSGDDGRIRMPSSSSNYAKMDFAEVETELRAAGFTNVQSVPLEDLITGILNKEGEVKEVSVDGRTTFSTDTKHFPNVEIVVYYHSFPIKESSEQTSQEVVGQSETMDDAGEAESGNDISEANVGSTEGNTGDEVIVNDIYDDFSKVIATTNSADPIIKEFALTYIGQKIEFDACVTYLDFYRNYNTRYDILVSTGDYVDEDTANHGPTFKFENVGATTLSYNVKVGDNVTVVAEIVSYNEDTGIFRLSLDSIEQR